MKRNAKPTGLVQKTNIKIETLKRRSVGGVKIGGGDIFGCKHRTIASLKKIIHTVPDKSLVVYPFCRNNC